MIHLLAALLLLAAPAWAGDESLDYAWRSCQAQRETTVVNGRIAFGNFLAAVRADCEGIAAQVAARPPPPMPTQAEIDAIKAAAIAGASPTGTRKK